MSNILQSTFDKIDKIINFLGVVEDKEKIKENLIASIYLEIIKQIGTDPNNKDLLLELSKKEPKTKEEYNTIFDYTQQKTRELGYDANLEFEKASRVVLGNFIKEMQNDLTPEKTIQLQNIVAE